MQSKEIQIIIENKIILPVQHRQHCDKNICLFGYFQKWHHHQAFFK